jgi:arginyl-tRNA synthetase
MVDTKFDLDSILSFEGDTGPYVQNALVRLSSILRKAEVTPSLENLRWELLCEPETEGVLQLLGQFPARVEQAVEQNEPSLVSQYCLELAEAIHQFYGKHRVLNVPETPERLALVEAARRTLATALALLGLEPIDRM